MTRDNNVQRRDVLRAAAAAGLGLMGTGGAWAQASAWPAKPVNLVVPFPAGGGTDAFARPLAAQFSKSTGKTLVIDNRGGAGGTVGASFAARAAAGIERIDHVVRQPAQFVVALARREMLEMPEAHETGRDPVHTAHLDLFEEHGQVREGDSHS